MALPTTRARIVVRNAFVALVAGGQLWCALELLGVRLPPPSTVLAGEVALVVTAALLGLRESGEDAELARWSPVGVFIWIVWGTFYFGAAHITEPPHARTFSDAILDRLPLLPAFAAIYLGVHVFSMVPYCALPEQRLLRRYMLGNILIILISAIAWVTLPVRLDRPPFDWEAAGFGTWLLRGVYRWDPTTNCFPSAHCAIAIYAGLALRFASRRLFVWGMLTALAICLSTIMTKQHYVADVAGGAVLAAIIAWAVGRRRRTLEPAR